MNMQIWKRNNDRKNATGESSGDFYAIGKSGQSCLIGCFVVVSDL